MVLLCVVQVELRVELKQRNLDELERLFWAVSDPQSEHYGKFLTIARLRELIAPPDAHVKVSKHHLYHE